MNIHMPSVIKSGGIAAAVNLVLGLLAALPLVGCFFVPLVCLGWFVVPTAAGLGYGYLAPGKENLGESALGGALAGGFGGFVNGLAVGLLSLVTNAGFAAMSEDVEALPAALAGGVVGLTVALCVPTVGGLFFGAIGGAIWPAVQGERL